MQFDSPRRDMGVWGKIYAHLPPEQLEEVAICCANISQNEENVSYWLALQVLRFFLGNEWVNSNADRQHTDVPRHLREGRDFLKTETQGGQVRCRHYQRVVELAECLYNFQHIPGFKHRIAILGTANLETASGEVECAKYISHPALKLKFIVPQSVKGLDYEAEIVAPSGRPVYCEIKTKKESTELGYKTMRYTLEHARKQLPEGKAGMVLVKIPENWMLQNGANDVIIAAVADVLRQTSRIAAVVIIWDECKLADGGLRLEIQRKLRILPKKNGPYLADIEGLLAVAGTIGTHTWVCFRTSVERLLKWDTRSGTEKFLVFA